MDNIDNGLNKPNIWDIGVEEEIFLMEQLLIAWILLLE